MRANRELKYGAIKHRFSGEERRFSRDWCVVGLVCRVSRGRWLWDVQRGDGEMSAESHPGRFGALQTWPDSSIRGREIVGSIDSMVFVC
jgi:hypothetical protein